MGVTVISPWDLGVIVTRDNRVTCDTKRSKQQIVTSDNCVTCDTKPQKRAIVTPDFFSFSEKVVRFFTANIVFIFF